MFRGFTDTCPNASPLKGESKVANVERLGETSHRQRGHRQVLWRLRRGRGFYRRHLLLSGILAQLRRNR